jgi:hypothetical protein
MAPDIALAGTELEGFVSCSVSPCRAFGFDGQPAVVERSGGSKDITWTYTDAGSQRPLGIRIIQRSFDGQNRGDYVLYAFRIFNEGTRALTFAPGVFLDFDVTPDFFSNVGYTELDGRLMVTTSAGEEGLHFGSMIMESPAARRSYFFNSDLLIPETEVVAALRGEIRNPALPDPTDVRLLQGGNSVRLKPGRSTDFWVAIVAGESRRGVVASARLALAEANIRRGSNDSFAAAPGARTMEVRSQPAARSSAVGRAKKVCKANCEGSRD